MLNRQTTDHYFEAHVTTDPYFDDDYGLYKTICSRHGFRPAKLLMQKTKEVNNLDQFCTARGTNYTDVLERMFALVDELQDYGFVVRRYKLENTLIDERISK